MLWGRGGLGRPARRDRGQPVCWPKSMRCILTHAPANKLPACRSWRRRLPGWPPPRHACQHLRPLPRSRPPACSSCRSGCGSWRARCSRRCPRARWVRLWSHSGCIQHALRLQSAEGKGPGFAPAKRQIVRQWPGCSRCCCPMAKSYG